MYFLLLKGLIKIYFYISGLKSPILCREAQLSELTSFWSKWYFMKRWPCGSCFLQYWNRHWKTGDTSFVPGLRLIVYDVEAETKKQLRLAFRFLSLMRGVPSIKTWIIWKRAWGFLVKASTPLLIIFLTHFIKQNIHWIYFCWGHS